MCKKLYFYWDADADANADAEMYMPRFPNGPFRFFMTMLRTSACNK